MSKFLDNQLKLDIKESAKKGALLGIKIGSILGGALGATVLGVGIPAGVALGSAIGLAAGAVIGGGIPILRKAYPIIKAKIKQILRDLGDKLKQVRNGNALDGNNDLQNDNLQSARENQQAEYNLALAKSLLQSKSPIYSQLGEENLLRQASQDIRLLDDSPEQAKGSSPKVSANYRG